MVDTPAGADRFRTAREIDDEPVVERRRTFFSPRNRPVLVEERGFFLWRWSRLRTFFTFPVLGLLTFGALTAAGDSAHRQQYENQPTVRPPAFQDIPDQRNQGQPIDPIGMGAEAPRSNVSPRLVTTASVTDIPTELSPQSSAIIRMTEGNVARASAPIDTSLTLSRGVEL